MGGVAWWPRGWCSQLQIEQSGFKPCPGTLPCVFGRDTDKFNAGGNPGIDQHPIQCFLVSHFLPHVVLHTMYSIGTNGVKFNIMIHCAAPKNIHTCPPPTERIGVSLGEGGGWLSKTKHCGGGGVGVRVGSYLPWGRYDPFSLELHILLCILHMYCRHCTHTSPNFNCS